MKIRRSLKRGAVQAGRLIHGTRAGRFTRRIILCYHSVHPNMPFSSTHPEAFERQIEWLRQTFDVVPLREIAEERPVPKDRRSRVALTFDDGYEDNHRFALPTLLKHSIPATFFVTTGFVDGDPAVRERFARLWRCSPDAVTPMSWDQVREIHSSGLEVGSHSVTHANLARAPRSRLADELRGSRDLVSDRLGVEIDMLAYPFGKPRSHVTPAVVDAARVAGYRLAVAVTFRAVRPSDSPLRLPRLFADGDTIDKLRDKIEGAYDPIGAWQEHAPLPLVRLVSPRDFHD
jgi:peptidoglycan/xylan/chitin deacetylase (PgdA/CDA1 family)